MDPFTIALLVGGLILATAGATYSAAKSTPQQLANESEGDTFLQGALPALGILGAGAGGALAAAAPIAVGATSAAASTLGEAAAGATTGAVDASTTAGSIAADAASGAAQGGIDASMAGADSAGSTLTNAAIASAQGASDAADSGNAGAILNQAATGASTGGSDASGTVDYKKLLQGAVKGVGQAMKLADSKQSTPNINTFQQPTIWNNSIPITGQAQQPTTTPMPYQNNTGLMINPMATSDLKSKTNIHNSSKYMDNILSSIYLNMKSKGK